jgi:eukaryotic-like serine/threonine-protein kinase
VIYEMIAGRVPFDGATSSDVIVSILEKEPMPLSRYAAEVPSELERIVKKALAKDRDERYQIAKDLLIDLKNLKQEQELLAKLNVAGLVSSEDVASATSEGQPTVDTDGKRATETGEVESAGSRDTNESWRSV